MAMKLHEFQSKALLSARGIGVPEGRVALTAAEARAAAEVLCVAKIAVKSQILAGGRGLAGGVQLVSTPEQAGVAAASMLGRTLVTEQTGPAGSRVNRVLIEAAVHPVRSLYLSLSIDIASAEIMVLAGAEGSEDIERRLQSGETRLERISMGTGDALAEDVAINLAKRIGLGSSDLQSAFAQLLDQLRRIFVELDATLLEINPLAVTEQGGFVAVDAKMIIDDNALFRHPELVALRDEHDDDAVELVAQNRQLNYLRMDGNIGLAVNGAGLGLATLDMVYAAKGKPANFMDIRTTATSLDVAHGFTLLLNNPAVRSILVNVHGGGMQPCDTIADGLGIAMRRTGRTCPVIVRLAGNNAEYARFRFANFGCKVIDCPDMWTAVTRATSAAQSNGERP
ncbi:ADP-forming succinate--CoA ligase subunit beta [Phyllobacterium meliloti]|uniref:ADP-forming succinate--CoA ligase subunit beta n=1 Tax=Phyllobacterium meliloti TaxID=555317 RepID=UPI001D147C21|nr:ADP-forming succinate--CoA ligase subunit beta [Phyllobacterium sp. T1293]UGX88332.1 ADP-forming succinate--CoA ligase subunit beta [Phyllobacterium sp. T1293]